MARTALFGTDTMATERIETRPADVAEVTASAAKEERDREHAKGVRSGHLDPPTDTPPISFQAAASRHGAAAMSEARDCACEFTGPASLTRQR